MAGFAVVMAALTYGVCGLIVTGIMSIGFYRHAKKRRSPRIAATGALVPFLALIWLLVSLLLHVAISNRLAHQDCGFSSDPYVRLPNGYTLGSLNTSDGYFKAPGFETDVAVEGPGYVRSIVSLQLSDGYFTGTQFNFRTSRLRSFIFNTATRDFQSSDTDNSSGKECNSTDLYCVEQWSRANTSAQTGANSYWKIYFQYRHHWPNYVLIALIVFGEATIALWAKRVWLQSAP